MQPNVTTPCHSATATTAQPFAPLPGSYSNLSAFTVDRPLPQAASIFLLKSKSDQVTPQPKNPKWLLITLRIKSQSLPGPPALPGLNPATSPTSSLSTFPSLPRPSSSGFLPVPCTHQTLSCCPSLHLLSPLSIMLFCLWHVPRTALLPLSHPFSCFIFFPYDFS